jgi:hypothetical protein
VTGPEDNTDRTHVRVVFPLQQDEEGWPPAASEGLWAEVTDRGGEYRVDNIPLWIEGVSVNDIVAARSTPDGIVFTEVVEKSGHKTIGVFYETEDTRDAVRARLIELGCEVERGDAWNVPDGRRAARS